MSSFSVESLVSQSLHTRTNPEILTQVFHQLLLTETSLSLYGNPGIGFDFVYEIPLRYGVVNPLISVWEVFVK